MCDVIFGGPQYMKFTSFTKYSLNIVFHKINEILTGEFSVQFHTRMVFLIKKITLITN